MNYGKLVLHVAACAAIGLSLNAGSARADIITTAPITGFVYAQPGNLLNATDPASPSATPTGISIFEGSFTANGIDFSATGSDTLKNFVQSGGGTPSALLSASPLYNQPMSNPTAPLILRYSTAIKVVSNNPVTFAPGTYTISHDDGVVAFIGTTKVVEAPAPVALGVDTFTITTTQTGVFTAFYEATNGNPEKLKVAFAPAVPEPTSVLLLGTVVALAGLRLRKSRKA